MAAGLTQRALASRAGLSGKYVSEIERGTRDVPFSTLHALVERGLGLALDVSFLARGGRRAPDRPRQSRAVEDLAERIAGLEPALRRQVVKLAREIVALASR
jgi:transcriptional regulator with XRE-family HTH domain